jgi:hypothetical protein
MPATAITAAGGREERAAGWFRLWMLWELCNIVAVEVERFLGFFFFFWVVLGVARSALACNFRNKRSGATDFVEVFCSV